VKSEEKFKRVVSRKNKHLLCWFFNLTTGSYLNLLHIVDYINEIFAVPSCPPPIKILIFLSLMVLEKFAFLEKGGTVLIKYHHLILAVSGC
jgi:hypothetical protein